MTTAKKIKFVENREANVIQIQEQVLKINRAVQKYDVEFGFKGTNPITDEDILGFTGKSADDLAELMKVYKSLLAVYTPDAAAILAKWDVV